MLTRKQRACLPNTPSEKSGHGQSGPPTGDGEMTKQVHIEAAKLAIALFLGLLAAQLLGLI